MTSGARERACCRPLHTKWLGFLALCAIALTACGGPTFTYRYRLTVEVDTPKGVKSGSSVIETTLQNNHGVKWAPMEARKFASYVRGDAVFVDLGQGRHVIALLAMGKAAQGDLDFRTIVLGSLGVRWWDPALVLPALTDAVDRRAVLEVPSAFLPTLVMFRDLGNPVTAKIIEPDAFDFVFGAGHSLRRVTVQMVPMGWWPLNALGLYGASVTREIEQKLPWVITIRGYLSGKFACNPRVELCLDVGQFRRTK